MTYASGGLIQAADFNNLNGASAGTQGGGTQMNPVWSTGQGSYGYGQTAIGNVSVSGSVAASDWATLINRLNTSRTHQSGSGSGISAPVAGGTVTFLSTLSSAISTAATNRLTTAYAAPSSVASTKNIAINVGASVQGTSTVTWTITWSSADQARYFFNAGGYIIISSGTFTNSGGTSRGTSINTLCATNFASKRINATTMGARTGAGGTLVTDTTGTGYYSFPTGATEYLRINSTSYYSGDYVTMSVNTNGTTGSYGANGTTMTISFFALSATTGSTQPSDSINITQGMVCTAYYPPTAGGLSNTWGTVTIT